MNTAENWKSVAKFKYFFWLIITFPILISLWIGVGLITILGYEMWQADLFGEWISSLPKRQMTGYFVAMLIAISGTWGWIEDLLPSSLSFLFRNPVTIINQDGIRHGWRTYSWKEIQEIGQHIKEGWISDTHLLLLDTGKSEPVEINLSRGTSPTENGWETAQKWFQITR